MLRGRYVNRDAEAHDAGVRITALAARASDDPAAMAFHALAARVVEDLLPPVEMSGCTARILDLASRIA